MKKIPYGIFDYRKLQEEGYIYVDKTMYLEKLENAASTIICLRPGRFGKSLMTSMMYYYYDINSSNLFDTLFKDTYVYNNPTPNKNNYYVLKFDFSGLTIADRTKEELERIFNNKVIDAINYFIFYYNLDYIIEEKNITSAEILSKFLTYMSKKTNNKVYILVDEYDNFANGILEGDASLFESIVSETGFVKAFYAVIKTYIGMGVVDRFYATGICPVTLNSMTTGFNIATDISTDERFNECIGLTHEEVITLLKELDLSEDEEKELYKLMIENYDGYLFNRRSKRRVFNATLVMYLLSNYQGLGHLPETIVDKNITANYGKIENLIKIKGNNHYKELLSEIIRTDEVTGELIDSFNMKIPFNRNDIISLLYYFGYLTIKEETITGGVLFRIPNYTMKETYNNYFLNILRDAEISIDKSKITESIIEIIKDGSITKISEYISEVLSLSDNRMFIKFDEKYIQALYFGLLVGNDRYKIYTEYPNSNGYIDIMIIGNKEYMNSNIMIELKYIKKSEYSDSKVEEKVREGNEQLMRYELDERIERENLKKYLVVYVGSELKLIESV